MYDYLQQLQKLIDISSDDVDSVIIVNKDGYIEYYKSWENPYSEYMTNHRKRLIGKHVLDIYPNLTEETSTIVQTLRTGKPSAGVKQDLPIGSGYWISIISTTYPLQVGDDLICVVDCSKCCGIKHESSGVITEKQRLYTLDDIITQSPCMTALKERIAQVAQSMSNVLICGETGTGKELVAESIHTASSRRRKPFLAQNCAAIPSELLESIFFGTEKGSFTGAESKMGLFEMAAGGTLFLDEINSMSLAMQVKLLKALEEKKIRRLGGTKDIVTDVRVVCATNELPELLLQERRLREDLYYRISVVRLEIPPLRDRREDISLLTNYFIRRYNRQMGRSIQALSDMVSNLFSEWDWPGNVRELKNTIESAFNVAQGDHIVIHDIHNAMRMIHLTPFQYNDSEPQDSAGNPDTAAGFHMGSNTGSSTASGPDFLTGFGTGSPLGSHTGSSSPAANASVSFPAARSVRSVESADLPREELPALLLSKSALHQALDGDGVDLQAILGQCEAYLIRAALSHEEQRKDAAKKLSLSPQSLHYKLCKYDLR